MNIFIAGACSITTLLFVTTVLAAELSCKVIRVKDGDSLTCLNVHEQRIEVNLAGVDAPELAQPYGQESKLKLFHLIYNKRVKLEIIKQTRYGPKLAHAYIGDIYVNAEMIKEGAAWTSQEVNGDSRLPLLEAEAKSLQNGLWGLPQADIIPPWHWRNNNVSQRIQF